MHIKEGLEYEPIAFKIIGSGIDDAVWFSFETDETDFSRIFDDSFVSPDSLSTGVSINIPEDMPSWWDAPESDLYGRSFSLAGAKHMTVGINRVQNGSIVYIFWNET